MFSCEASSEAGTAGDGANLLMSSFNGYHDDDEDDDFYDGDNEEDDFDDEDDDDVEDWGWSKLTDVIIQRVR